LTDAGRQRLWAAALRYRPWQHATGPTTAAGKEQVKRNGKKRQLGPRSTREILADLADLRVLVRDLRACRALAEAE
jgi:hypothetical protein